MIINNTGLQSHRSCLSLTHTLCHSVLAKHTIYLDLNSYTHLTLNPTLLHLVSFFFFFPPKDSPLNLICSPSAARLRPAPVYPPVFMNFEVVGFFFFKTSSQEENRLRCLGKNPPIWSAAYITVVNHLSCAVHDNSWNQTVQSIQGKTRPDKKVETNFVLTYSVK